MSIACPNCNSVNDDNVKFCPVCGNKLIVDEPASAITESEPVADVQPAQVVAESTPVLCIKSDSAAGFCSSRSSPLNSTEIEVPALVLSSIVYDTSASSSKLQSASSHPRGMAI